MSQRIIATEVDQSSWKGPVPSDILSLANKASVSLTVDVALLFTGLITRPPEVLGFSLADAWAWLRYRPALAQTQDLRLKSEWKDIDPHQKTILSDELGMGFTAYLLARELDFRVMANTLHFVRVIAPSSYFLASSTMNGQKKSPDFVALDSQNRVSAFECKGTQESRRQLRRLTENGIAQKKNLKARAGSSLLHALVVGLFIPQFANNEDSLIHLRDPEDSKFDELLKSVSHEQQIIALVQISLAKHFSLMGLSSIANSLARRPIENNPTLETVEIDELGRLEENVGDSLSFQIDHPVPPGGLNLRDRDASSIIFSMSCPRDLYLRLIEAKDLNSQLLRLAESASHTFWLSRQDESLTTLSSPLGFHMSLEYSVWTRTAGRQKDVAKTKKEPHQDELF